MAETATKPSISEELARLSDEAKQLEIHLEQQKSDMERAKARHGSLKSDISALGRAAAELSKLNDEAKKKLEEARQEVAACKGQVLQDLADDTEQRLRDGVEAINEAQAIQLSKMQDAEKDLPAAEDAQVQQQKAVQRAQAKLDMANKAVQNVPAEIKAYLDSLQKVVTALRDSAGSGQSKKAFVMIEEIQRLDAEITKLTNGSQEQARIQAAHDAEQALRNAQADLATKDLALSEKKAELQQASEELARLKKSRDDDLKKLSTSEVAGPTQARTA